MADRFFNMSGQYRARLCPAEMDKYIQNLTSSYTETSHEASMVSASVIMFFLAGLFFNLNLFSGISDVSATLDPKVRIFLTTALSLLLPVMSYLFSEAKNAAPPGGELSLGAGLILAWMLLVELLRKKVDEIRMRGLSGSVQRAGRVGWLGSLVFFNIKTAGRKAVFGILWILCATRVVQRIAYTELGKHSYAHGRNARLIHSYMAKMLRRQRKQGDRELLPVQQQQQQKQGDHDLEHAAAPFPDGQELLRRCQYIVMGEEELVGEPIADGYELLQQQSDGQQQQMPLRPGVVTVGGVWKLAENDASGISLFVSSPDQVRPLKRLCLSFALFKLLRRKFEHLPAVSDEEAQDCRDLILKGLPAEEVFQVVNDEVVFLSEYYHSVVPVVLASPSFLVVNYFLVLVVVAFLCFMTVVLCGNGDYRYAFGSLAADNYTLHSGLGKIALCLISKARTSPQAFFSTVDLSITALLFVIYFYEEVWEFFVFVLSNWLAVSLLGHYVARPAWSGAAAFRYLFRRVMWLRGRLSHGEPSFRQFSVLHYRLPLKLISPALALALAPRKRLVPRHLKRSVVARLADSFYAAPLTNGKTALRGHGLLDDLSWACESDSVAEVMLTWHVATGILEARMGAAGESDGRRTASRLSRYCAYLVAFHPELLPDNPEKAELVVEKMKEELDGTLGFLEYYLAPQDARVGKILKLADDRPAEEARDGERKEGVVRKGARLGRQLMGEAANKSSGAQEEVWTVVAEVWTELILFAAPSSEEERVKGHKEVLVQGGEFITVLWALATHTGVARARCLQDLFDDSKRSSIAAPACS